MKPQESSPFNQKQVQQLKKLVAHGEGFQLEFKRKAAFPEKIVREMIAFANSKGGILLVGIGDDGSIPGLKHPEDDAHVINLSLKNCKPPLPIKEIFIPVGQNRSVIQYEISESTRKPHYYLTSEKMKETFVRVADKSIKASREMREISRRAQRNKDIRFHYGDHEHWLMQYLQDNRTITLKEFTELSGLKRFIASKKLILLVLADVLRITPHEKGDVFSLAFKQK
ncbi:MAG TPA: ATP-binding protein [Ohtaekwangia sp.]|nr:ATP-binding protein [Ohtaekwangia sp.]